MIDEISVSDIALIREASLSPSPALTVLTGETGAGKTALVSAVKLLVGERADASAVREGARSAQVSGRLFPGIGEADDLVVTRRIGADGRSRATLNGAMASVSELARTVGARVELCGQHEFQALLKPAEHGRILDAWGSLGEVAETYRAALATVREREAALQALREQAHSTNAQLDEARFTVAQIQAVNPQGGEYEELRDWLSRAENAETLARASHGAAEALSGDGGALDALNTAIALIYEAARADESLAGFASSLRETCYVVEDVARDMGSYASSIDFDAASLAEAQDRLGALMGLMHSFGPTMDAVFERWDEAAALLAVADNADDHLARAERELDEAEAALAEAAEAYDAARAEAAPRFATAVGEVLSRLEMGSAELVCTVAPLAREAWNSHGSASVTFEFKPGKSMQARPLARIASGGEISRVMLAVKVALGAKDGTETLVFDEVDAGVGGSTANALAAVLAELSRSHQVIVITHLAQVAALADKHYRVTKTKGDTPETQLSVVEGDERVAEVARLLSGTATETSLAHARELLEARTS